MGKLTARKVETAKAGKHGDSDGLQLVVTSTGARKWVLRFMLAGRAREMGLGSYPEVGLAEARAAAFEARKLVAGGTDPIEARDAARKADAQARKAIPTFADIAALVIADAQAQSTNEKVKYQWARHLGPAYCAPLLLRPVNEISTLDVAAVLRPVWESKPEVARKLHPAIRRVFERARVILKAEHGVVILENPANWSDMKAQGFSKPRTLSRGRHPSLPYPRMPEFTAAMRAREAVAARPHIGVLDSDECEDRRGLESGMERVRPERRALDRPAGQAQGPQASIRADADSAVAARRHHCPGNGGGSIVEFRVSEQGLRQTIFEHGVAHGDPAHERDGR